MKKSLLLLSSALFMLALAAAPGCSGGDDDDDDDDDGGTLASGTYGVTVQTPTDTCFGQTYTEADSFYASSQEAEVTVTGASMNVEFDFGFATTYDITGTSLFDPSSPGVGQTLDFTEVAVYMTNGLAGPVDCTVDISQNYTGEITGTNAFTLTDTYQQIEVNSGTECNALVTSGLLGAIPCNGFVDSIQLSF